MLNVLIADDEQKICQLIEKLIDWPGLNMQVIATAANGLEALEHIRRSRPDIVITDIRMPGYDGLELIRLGKEVNPKTEFIIISGYRHFEYAQTAIRYGVNAYVLKPIRKDELTQVLNQLGDKLRENELQRNNLDGHLHQTQKTDKETLRQTFLSDLIVCRCRERLSYPLEQINQEFRYSFSTGEFCFAIVKVDGRVFDDRKNLGLIADKLYHAARRLFHHWSNEYEITALGSSFYFLFQLDAEQKHGLRRQFKLLLDELRVQGEILQNISVTAALGKSYPSLPLLEPSLAHVRRLMEERLVVGTGKLLEEENLKGDLLKGEFYQRDTRKEKLYQQDTFKEKLYQRNTLKEELHQREFFKEDVYPKESFTESTAFSEFQGRFSQALEGLEVFSVRDALIKLKNQVLSQSSITGHELLQTAREVGDFYLFSMKNYRIRIEEDFQERLLSGMENCASAAELFDYLIRALTISYEKAARQKRQDENRPIRIVKQFITSHYGESLTLEQASDAAGLSPAYLGTLFKKETGMTFLEYLSGVRMEAAKQLLKETNRTVADICMAVGYNDVRYFTKSFTKYSGLKPNEYRKLYS